MMVWSDQSQFPFYVIDNNGNIILTIDEDGFHLVGSAGRIDMELSGGQPTIFFRDLAGNAQSFINAPIFGGNFATIALDSDTWVSTLPGNPVLRALLFLQNNFIQLGPVGPGLVRIGAQLDFNDHSGTLFIADQTGTVLNKIVQDANGIQLTKSGNGFGLSQTSGYLHRVDGGTFLGWQPLSILFQNGWTNLGGNWETGQYKLTADGIVEFQGTIIGGTKADGTVLWTMPAAYRPSKDKIMNCTIISSGSAANVSLRIFAATGQVQCFGINATVNGNMSLESTRYSLF